MTSNLNHFSAPLPTTDGTVYGSTEFTTQTPNGTETSTQSKIEYLKKVELIPCCIIIVVGFLANSTVIWSGIRKRAVLKHFMNCFVISMAVADMGVVVTAIPLHIVENLRLLSVDYFTCAYILPVRETFQCNAMLSIAALALVRLRLVTKQPHTDIPLRYCAIILAVIWVTSYLVIPLPCSFFFKIVKDECRPVYDNEKQWKALMSVAVTMLLLPVIVATISYAVIVMRVKDLMAPSKPRATNEATAVRENEKNGVKRRTGGNISALLFLLIIAGWITYLPLAICYLFVIYSSTGVTRTWFSVVTLCYYSGSAINPLLVLITQRRYRLSCPKRQLRVGVLDHNAMAIIVRPHAQLLRHDYKT